VAQDLDLKVERERRLSAKGRLGSVRRGRAGPTAVSLRKRMPPATHISFGGLRAPVGRAGKEGGASKVERWWWWWLARNQVPLRNAEFPSQQKNTTAETVHSAPRGTLQGPAA